MLSLHSYNESQRVPDLLARLEAGENIALVSDAGTPLLSDPGFELVSRAAAPALKCWRSRDLRRSLPHSPSRDYRRVAFASKDFFRRASVSDARSSRSWPNEIRTLVFFEAPHRIADTLADLTLEFGGERQAVVARELTKTHETDLPRHSRRADSARRSGDANFQRGEITIVVDGAPPSTTSVDPQLLRRAVELLSKELPPSRAAAIAAQLTGATRNEAYALATRGGHRARGRRKLTSRQKVDFGARAPYCGRRRAGWVIAASDGNVRGGRKVRAPADQVPGNAWGARAHGKCNREQTA